MIKILQYIPTDKSNIINAHSLTLSQTTDLRRSGCSFRQHRYVLHAGFYRFYSIAFAHTYKGTKYCQIRSNRENLCTTRRPFYNAHILLFVKLRAPLSTTHKNVSIRTHCVRIKKRYLLDYVILISYSGINKKQICSTLPHQKVPKQASLFCQLYIDLQKKTHGCLKSVLSLTSVCPSTRLRLLVRYSSSPINSVPLLNVTDECLPSMNKKLLALVSLHGIHEYLYTLPFSGHIYAFVSAVAVHGYILHNESSSGTYRCALRSVEAVALQFQQRYQRRWERNNKRSCWKIRGPLRKCPFSRRPPCQQRMRETADFLHQAQFAMS